jgi:hypothetical protein
MAAAPDITAGGVTVPPGIIFLDMAETASAAAATSVRRSDPPTANNISLGVSGFGISFSSVSAITLASCADVSTSAGGPMTFCSFTTAYCSDGTLIVLPPWAVSVTSRVPRLAIPVASGVEGPALGAGPVADLLRRDDHEGLTFSSIQTVK